MLLKKELIAPSLNWLSIRLIYSSGFKVGTPSAEATATHITAEELPLLAIVWAGVFAERTNEFYIYKSLKFES